MSWTTIELEVATPLFNAGVCVDPKDPSTADAGVRVSSLRGAMRFWFRALAGIGTGSDTAALARIEQYVFGTTDHASPVRMRILGRPPVSPVGQPQWCSGGDGRWIVYLLGQGLGDLRNVRVTRPYIAPGTRIRLQLRLGDDADVAALVLASLWLTCTFGGLGARVRRGFGALRIVGVDGNLPEPWTPQTLCSPGLDFYQPLQKLWPTGPLNACMPVLMRVAGSDQCKVNFTLAASQAPPTFPVFSKVHTAVGLSGGESFLSWSGLLGHTGEQLRHFRASVAAPGARYRPQIKSQEYLDVVHGHDRRYPVGALGLPVNYGRQGEVNAYGPGNEPLRRASPLWLRPVGVGREWRLLSFAFHGEFLPAGVRPRLRRDRRLVKEVIVEQADVVTRTNKWIKALSDDTDLRVDNDNIRR